MSVSFATAAAASGEVKDLIGKLTEVVTVGVTKVAADFGVKVNLAENPKPEVAEKLPKEYRGVPIVIDVTGFPRAGG